MRRRQLKTKTTAVSPEVLRQEAHAREQLARLKPLDQWVAEFRPTEEQKAMRDLVVRNLEQVAAGGLRALPPGAFLECVEEES